jgi:6,7-dimethyl-8-ribityllumazine synthase
MHSRNFPLEAGPSRRTAQNRREEICNLFISCVLHLTPVTSFITHHSRPLPLAPDYLLLTLLPMSSHFPSASTPASGETLASIARVAVVAARFNAHIVDELLRGCIGRLAELGLHEHNHDNSSDNNHNPDSYSTLVVHRVPGAFELPVAAKMLIDAGHFDAVICLGCIIRGDTPHFEYVAGETARGIQQVAINTGVPVIFGVLTTHTEQQALDRTGGIHSHAGINAADAAAEMIRLRHAIINI